MRDDLKPGNIFPDFTLADQTGAEQSLSGVMNGWPLVLTFNRGNYWPKDARQLAGYAMHLQPDLAVSYYGIVTVTTEPRLETVEMRNGVGALWPFLSDPERTVLHQLELADESEHRYGPVFIPTTFVLDADRTIHSVYNGWWFVGRPTPEELRQDMRAIFSKRDDWEFNKDWTAGGLAKYMGGKK